MVRVLHAFSGSGKALNAETRAPRNASLDRSKIIDRSNLAESARF